MKYPQENLEHFFGALIGSPEAVDDTYHQIASRVTADSDIQDPYERLDSSVTNVLYETIRAQKLPNIDNHSEVSKWESIYSNGFSGLSIAVATLRAVGKVYDENTNGASLPQKISNVRRNTDGALHHVYTMAFASSTTSYKNLSAIRFGRSPRNPLIVPMGVILGPLGEVVHSPEVSEKAFSAKTDDDGQITIKPRHSILKDKSGRKCPAPLTRVELGGHKKPALLTLMKTIGEVAVNEIFSHQFAIEDN